MRIGWRDVRRAVAAGGLTAAWLMTWLVAGSATGQELPSAWVAESDAQMWRNRTARLRVVVLDAAGSPVPGAVVEAVQVSHELPIGFVASRAGLDGIDLSEPVYRQFNTVSLDRLVRWREVHPRADAEHPMLDARRVAHQARQRGLAVRLGPIVSEDAAHNPDWAAALPPEALHDAVGHRLEAALRDFGVHAGPSTQVDVIGHALSHRHLTDTLGPATPRVLLDLARTICPDARLAVRFSDALTGHRRSRLASAVADLREGFVDIDLIAIDERVTGGVQRAPLQRTLDAIDRLGYGVAIASLDVGGGSPEAAAYAMELLLRTVVPHPACRGVMFHTLVTPLEGQAAEPGRRSPPEHAGLIDPLGQLTPAGRVVERLFGQAWRSREMAITDPELAGADLVMYAGTYDFTVMLPPTPEHPEGRSFTRTLRLPASEQPRFTALQPLRGE
jgi:hypothetical protein